MSRGMSRGGSFPIIIAVLGTLIVAVIAIFVYLQFAGGGNNNALNADGAPTPTLMATATPGVTPTPSPMPTPEVTPPPVENTPTVEPTATVAVTPPPVYASATVYANALVVHADADLDSPSIGKVRREEVLVVVDETSKFLKVEFNGGYGWVWAAYCVRGGEALPAAPAEADFSVVKSWGTPSGSSSNFTATISFASGVYGDEGLSGAIQAADFSVSGGTMSAITNNAVGTESVTITIVPSSSSTSEVKVTINKNAVFTSGGKADDGSSHTYDVPGVSSDDGDDEYEGTGDIVSGNCSVSGDAEITAVNHNASDKTVTVTLKATDDLESGDTVKVTVSAYNEDAESMSAYTVHELTADVAKGASIGDVIITFGEGAYRTTAVK